MVAGALSAAWRQGKVLVDSGSQQEPLLSHDFAAAVAGPPGPVVGAAAQADGFTDAVLAKFLATRQSLPNLRR